mmetsp:Transcript_61098/g.177116  ORF Transcript_61098/g.177116 Transcript_61098/m.177116 type:complete len:267 (-) Transcript_61098:530-1330(-)
MQCHSHELRSRQDFLYKCFAGCDVLGLFELRRRFRWGWFFTAARVRKLPSHERLLERASLLQHCAAGGQAGEGVHKRADVGGAQPAQIQGVGTKRRSASDVTDDISEGADDGGCVSGANGLLFLCLRHLAVYRRQVDQPTRLSDVSDGGADVHKTPANAHAVDTGGTQRPLGRGMRRARHLNMRRKQGVGGRVHRLVQPCAGQPPTGHVPCNFLHGHILLPDQAAGLCQAHRCLEEFCETPDEGHDDRRTLRLHIGFLCTLRGQAR